jgi:hypothetical protein
MLLFRVFCTVGVFIVPQAPPLPPPDASPGALCVLLIERSEKPAVGIGGWASPCSWLVAWKSHRPPWQSDNGILYSRPKYIRLTFLPLPHASDAYINIPHASDAYINMLPQTWMVFYTHRSSFLYSILQIIICISYSILVLLNILYRPQYSPQN